MEKIAFIAGSNAYSWSTILVGVTMLGTALLFLGLYLHKTGNAPAAFVTVPIAVVLGVVFSRLLHWYCYEENYSGLRDAMTNLSTGGFGLLGAFAGCLAAAILTRMLELHRNLPQMLDCMCLAGSAGLAVGRLSAFFNSSDRGQVLTTIRSMPWAYPVTNAVSGAVEYRFATFLIQSLVAAALFVGLMVFSRRHRKRGDLTLIFLLIYCASQVVLDSTRYDSMYFRWNGFVSIVQVVCAVTLVVVIAVFSRRLVRHGGFRNGYLALWAGIFVCMAGAGYMEYHVQRHGSQALFAYGVMSGCLAVVVGLTLGIRGLAQKPAAHEQGGRFRKNRSK